MRAISRLWNLIRYLPPDSATAHVVPVRAPKVEMTRDVSVNELAEMHPNLFVRN